MLLWNLNPTWGCLVFSKNMIHFALDFYKHVVSFALNLLQRKVSLFFHSFLKHSPFSIASGTIKIIQYFCKQNWFVLYWAIGTKIEYVEFYSFHNLNCNPSGVFMPHSKKKHKFHNKLIKSVFVKITQITATFQCRVWNWDRCRWPTFQCQGLQEI